MKISITIDLPDDDPERLLERLRPLLTAQAVPARQGPPPAANGHGQPHRGQWGPPEGAPPAAAPQPEGDLPTSGKALFAWARGREEGGEEGLVHWLTEFGKARRYPGKITQWTTRQVREAMADYSQSRE